MTTTTSGSRSAPRVGSSSPCFATLTACLSRKSKSQLKEFGDKARDAKLGIDELTGGTFTITNGGVFGSLLSTPIINPPQSAILGMHRIQDRPIAEEAASGDPADDVPRIVLRSPHHRRTRGGVSFLVTLKQHLEDPARLILDLSRSRLPWAR